MPIWKHCRIYHMTEAPNWPSIQRHGLLCTSRLLSLCGLNSAERYDLERRQRVQTCRLPNGAVIRNQVPIPPEALVRCLAKGLKPADWYAELNARVFFWLDTDRLNRQRRACAASPQVVMTVDADRLLANYMKLTTLTPFNTGNARRKPARRGLQTFVPFEKWRESGWSSEAAALQIQPRPSSHPPVELAITDAVEDLSDFLVDVSHLAAGEYFSP